MITSVRRIWADKYLHLYRVRVDDLGRVTEYDLGYALSERAKRPILDLIRRDLTPAR